ncbi:MAG: Aspartate--tRNA(Asp/Asn) ligase [uncultured marine phage]|uniref:Aspartate--tRNA(Asp/Asn) ligase n=1 Tax=uncultured marine phage TaxID=707152 RepID=A0A8D9CAW7_9VIRU|nr:MAG: Aspartate--tRNA(Asp/Asn) ligase [uncultured marine phage]
MERILIKELKNKIGEKVKVQGWVQSYRRLGKKMGFIVLRERSGLTQIIIHNPKFEVNIESVIEVIGTVKEEKQSQYGNIEIEGEEIKILSEGQSELPITTFKKGEIPFSTLVNFNPLTLRMERRRAIFKLEAEVIWAFREYMKSQEFTEIHSTKLVNEGLEGGSGMFEVNYFGENVYLSQSPQFFKQMMVGVYERVFEVGKVYRAEGTNSNRHLSEYIGLDLEMGFIESVEEIMAVEEKMLTFVFNHLSETCKKELELFEVESPTINIPRITYNEAVEMIVEKHGEVNREEGFSNQMEIQISEIIKEKYGSEFVFITKYPLSKRPFYTMPSEEEGCSESFELIYKGLEITTGGQRIHNYEMLKEHMEKNELNPEEYEQYLMAFKYGMPAHGGCGIGTERILKQLLNLNTVEEASLVPRTKERFI